MMKILLPPVIQFSIFEFYQAVVISDFSRLQTIFTTSTTCDLPKRRSNYFNTDTISFSSGEITVNNQKHDSDYSYRYSIIDTTNSAPTPKIYIFDRFGKILKQFYSLESGWDRIYNGNSFPSSDYRFLVKYTEDQTEKEIKGHSTLKK